MGENESGAENRERLKANGTVLYLHVEPALLFERVRHARHRPLLRIGDPRTRLDELYAHYVEVATIYEKWEEDDANFQEPNWREEHDRLFAARDFALYVWEIARKYGMEAAMLFKLSDGNIDPRPRNAASDEYRG